MNMNTPVGAVVSDHQATSDIGRNILKRGGSAVDAAIAMVICNGVRTFHSMGIGGGSVCKVGIPGTIKACKVAHEIYGRLPWTDLFQPTIRMLREGFPMAMSTEKAFYLYEKYPERQFKNRIRSSSVLSSIFRCDGKQLRTGDIISLPNLADTLEGIADQGPDYLYNSHVTQAIVKELQQQGGVHIVEDFKKYKALHGRAFAMHFDDYILYTAYGASGGVIVAMALNILKGYNFTATDYNKLSDKAETCHKMLEVFRFIMPIKDKLGDPNFHDVDWIFKNATNDNFAAFIRSRIDADKTHEQEYYSDVLAKTVQDGGTSHISVLSPDGDTVSCTSTVTTYFGSTLMSRSTGIIWNDSLVNFAKEDNGTTINKNEPDKRPRSSMAPIIITNKQGHVVLAIGAAGGHKIITTLVQVIANLLWFKLPLPRAVEEKRLHYDTAEDCILVEDGFSENIKGRLLSKGHVMQVQRPYNISVVEAIFIDDNGVIHAHADSRKQPGKALYIYPETH